ncbi:hypothetical protein O3G_MSEX011304 [Manduca sexta]|uniref:BTB domain-containing protein n=1 Tax=Manduca sexta TaxID=7130 RepID=A0A922CV59_MANSE|nr:hypothetical protein O3G_MSEX011304 [Manduca sexta]
MVYLENEKTHLPHSSLYDRVKKLLVSFEWSDCGFTVLGKTIKAHKLILGISSPVFEAMFYGPMSKDEDIEVTDIQPDIFQLMVNYIYTDNVEISNIEQAFELLYASRKYLLEHLTEICITYIKANLSVDNVIEVLNYPDYMHGKQLISYSLKLFGVHASYLLQEKKNLMTHLCMKAILETDHMNVSEKELIKHVFEWSAHLCDQNSLPATLENRYNLLKKYGIFKLLRFSTLNLDELDEIICDKNSLLSPPETESIRKQIKESCNVSTTEIVTPVGSSNIIPRNSLTLRWHRCFRSPLRSMAPIIIDSNNYAIHCRLKASKSVFINSLCVPPRMEPIIYVFNKTKAYSEQLSVSIMCESDNSIIKYTNFMNTVEYYASVIDIELKEPCFIEKDKWYKISFVWPHNRLPTYSYFVEFRDKFLMFYGDNVKFEFDDLPLSAGNGGSFLAGLKFCL